MQPHFLRAEAVILVPAIGEGVDLGAERDAKIASPARSIVICVNRATSAISRFGASMRKASCSGKHTLTPASTRAIAAICSIAAPCAWQGQFWIVFMRVDRSDRST